MRNVFVWLALVVVASPAAASAESKRVTVKLADKVTSEVAPFGDYAEFVAPNGLPPLISFSLTVGDDCV